MHIKLALMNESQPLIVAVKTLPETKKQELRLKAVIHWGGKVRTKTVPFCWALSDWQNQLRAADMLLERLGFDESWELSMARGYDTRVAATFILRRV